MKEWTEYLREGMAKKPFEHEYEVNHLLKIMQERGADSQFMLMIPRTTKIDLINRMLQKYEQTYGHAETSVEELPTGITFERFVWKTVDGLNVKMTRVKRHPGKSQSLSLFVSKEKAAAVTEAASKFPASFVSYLKQNNLVLWYKIFLGRDDSVYHMWFIMPAAERPPRTAHVWPDKGFVVNFEFMEDETAESVQSHLSRLSEEDMNDVSVTKGMAATLRQLMNKPFNDAAWKKQWDRMTAGEQTEQEYLRADKSDSITPLLKV